MSARLSVPMPKRIANLDRDHRGYPIPYVAQRWRGIRIPPPTTAQFGMVAVPHKPSGKELILGKMDEERQRRCITESKCSVCGTKVPLNDRYLAGGADDPSVLVGTQFAFREPWVHGACMEYAVQVCPGLVVGVHSGRLRIVKPHQWEIVEERFAVSRDIYEAMVASGTVTEEMLQSGMVRQTYPASPELRRISVLFYLMVGVTVGDVMTVDQFLEGRS